LKTEANYTKYKRLRNETNKKVKPTTWHTFKGNPKKLYGYMRKVKTVKEKAHQLMNENGQLTKTQEETAQALGNFQPCFYQILIQMKSPGPGCPRTV